MRKSGILIAGVCLLALSGCGGQSAGKILGLEKRSPDEFTVVSRAPLTLPPDFGLRPPDPNAKRSREQIARDEAEAALFGKKRKRELVERSQREFDQGELSLLASADALAADPNIREVVDDESATLAVEADSFVDDLLFWKDKEPLGTVVDAKGEAQRIQENQGLGRSVEEGDTPMIRREGEDSTFDFVWPF
ncbi:DUF3035 domain-containing protein [Aestuariispira ectoiniformans]|uniref:DUF3035 domain-containing protein n=1 Tax=Aestuariispira ectoiniformans TaxID=2775080 RepID=UPI00223B7FC2|nr:DUF3035 domain-containing protein [Aestuariispira ectoiniformans]